MLVQAARIRNLLTSVPGPRRRRRGGEEEGGGTINVTRNTCANRVSFSTRRARDR